MKKAKLVRHFNVRELQSIVRYHQLEAADGRSLQMLRRAVSSSRSVQTADVVDAMREFSEQRVKELMELLGYPSHGRKNALIEYLRDAVIGQGDEESDDAEYDDDLDDGEEYDLELNQREATLLAGVPEDGSSIGNGKLRKLLDWDEDKYWKVRDSLVEKGYLAVGYGRGGSVYRVHDDAETDDSDEDDEEIDDVEIDNDREYRTEESLYADVRSMLEKNWQQLFPGFPTPKQHWVDSSPRQGRRKTGGKWTRPDVSAVTMNKYRYVPGVHLDVFTFEVKPKDQLNVLGLYEALGHSRRANFAYVLYHVGSRNSASQAEREKHDEQLEEIKREAARLKVGVATFEDPAQAETWTVHVVPGRHDPEARLLNEFVETLPEDIKRGIEDWVR